jgi:uncharacterized membrane protein YphA (DoxX/SURF4 family)
VKSSRILDIVGTVARLGLAAVWLTSGTLKAIDPDQTYVAVKAYDVLPKSSLEVVAALLPWVEIAFGVLLLVGAGVRIVAVLSLVLLAVFMAGVAQSWARGLSIDCGCFGGGGAVAPGDTAYLQELLRDTGFAVLAVWLVVRPRSYVALDSRLVDTTQQDISERTR